MNPEVSEVFLSIFWIELTKDDVLRYESTDDAILSKKLLTIMKISQCLSRETTDRIPTDIKTKIGSIRIGSDYIKNHLYAPWKYPLIITEKPTIFSLCMTDGEIEISIISEVFFISRI
jgi:hypothetical protein